MMYTHQQLRRYSQSSQSSASSSSTKGGYHSGYHSMCRLGAAVVLRYLVQPCQPLSALLVSMANRASVCHCRLTSAAPDALLGGARLPSLSCAVTQRTAASTSSASASVASCTPRRVRRLG